MGLTRIRAEQISDIDYKQAVRAVTLTNVTLAGGAPNSVDSINLVSGDRVLVAGQSTGSQNGLYVVQTVGAGSNGTWIRSSDGNTDGEIEAGMIVMVTEGSIYADTQWKLTTNDPITIGTTALVFEQSSAYAFGTISVSGQDNVVADAVGDTLTLASGNNISITTDASTDTVTIGVTGISLNSIANGNSNVAIGSTDGNVAVSVAGSSVANFSTAGLSITGNISGSNINTAGQLKTTGTFLLGTQQFYAQGSDGFSVNENFNAGNATVTAYHYTSGSGRNAIVFDTAVTGQFTTGFGTTGSAASNKFVFFAEFGNTVWEWRKSVGISAPNLNGGTLLANINADGNFWTSGSITGGNLSVTGLVAGNLIPSADITYSLGNATNRWSNLYLAGNTIYLGNSVITETADGDIVIENSGAFGVPVGTTAQRSNVQGAIRFNTDLSAFEVYDGVTWNTVALGTISDFPDGNYGDVTTITSDAFGVPLADTFDCNAEGALVTVDFEPLT